MDSQSLRVLEFPEVLELLAAQAESVLGRQRALALEPSSDPQVVTDWLAETREGRDLLRLGSPPSLERAADIRGALARAAIPGSRLSPQELLAIAQTLETATQVRRYLRQVALEIPRLRRLTAGLAAPPEVWEEIRRCLTPEGEMADAASPMLLQLRREARRTREEIREALQAMLGEPRLQPIIAEPVVTLRNDRYVIPVTPSYRALLNGIVQDQSATGHSLFLEPLAVVDLNNTIRRLEREIEGEVDRVLGELTAMVRTAGPSIAAAAAALAQFDVIAAKARLADRWNGSEPRVMPGGRLRLLQARHPLLVEARRSHRAEVHTGEVVPIDVALDGDTRIVVISGPNAGGKTVALKTVGLAALMAQTGLHVPASPNSEMPIFTSVLADIGDEQSIARDLSTFSAHVTRLRTILLEAATGSLVLLDEVGAGTEPGEGAALGSAILEALAGCGCHALATTHLEAVKAFVAQDLRMTNAAMEFDLDSLRPVYKLQIGLPGQSFAIDVACRLGIPPTIIQRSRELLGDTGAELQALLDRLQALERQRAGDASEAAQELAAAVASREAAGRLTDALREQAAVLRTQARRIVADIAAEARRRAEAIASELASGGSLREAREAIRHIPQAAERQLEEIPIREVGGEGEPALTGVEPGQRVWIRHLAQAGTVVSGPTGQGLVEVQLPLGKARVRLEGLAPAAPAAAPASGGIGWTAGAGDALGIEINVIGCTVEEAWARVERFVEDAVLGGLQRVRIVHGKGTGRLRRGLTALLKAHPLVAGCHLASFEEGGAGATIVDLGSEDGERVATGREGADRPHRIE